MKKLSLLFLAVFSIINLYAQLLPPAKSSAGPSLIRNGSVIYKMTVEGEDPQAKLLNNSIFELAFNGFDTKLNALVMGGLFGGNIIMDASKNQGLALMTIMGQKKAVKMNPEDIKKAQNQTATFDMSRVQALPGTVKIAGQTCKKVLIKDPKNPDVQTIVFLCENIKPESAGMIDNMMKNFKGFPMGMEVKSKKSKISLMATEISTKIPKKSDFKQEIPVEYEITTLDKIQEDMGMKPDK